MPRKKQQAPTRLSTNASVALSEHELRVRGIKAALPSSALLPADELVPVEQEEEAPRVRGVLGWKGAAKGKGVYALDAKKQSKQLLRLDAVVSMDTKGELAMTWKSSQVKLLEQLPPAKRARTEE